MKVLRSVEGSTLRDHVRSCGTFSKFGRNKTIIHRFSNYRKKIVQHVKRTVDTRIALQSLHSFPNGHRHLESSRNSSVHLFGLKLKQVQCLIRKRIILCRERRLYWLSVYAVQGEGIRWQRCRNTKHEGSYWKHMASWTRVNKRIGVKLIRLYNLEI